MSLIWEDARELVLAEHKRHGTISPSKRVHYYSKNLPTYSASMHAQDTLITMAWTLESLIFIKSNKELAETSSFLLRKCRKNLVDLWPSEIVLKTPCFSQEVLCLLHSIYLECGDVWRAEWQMSRVESFKIKNYQNPASDHSFFKFDSSVEDHLKNGEPYLAWQFIKLNSVRASNSECSHHEGELFLFSLFAPHDEVKCQLRKKRANGHGEILYCLLSLLSQGNTDWVNDSSLLRLIPRGKDPLTQILLTLIAVFQKGAIQKSSQEGLVFELEDIYCKTESLNLLAKLLILASLMRILKTTRQVRLLHLVEQRFVEVNLHFSEGTSSDIFRLFETKAQSKLKDHRQGKNLTDSSTQSVLNRIPHSLIDRSQMGLSLTYDLAKVLGTRRLTYFLTGQRSKIHLKATELNKILELISNKMSELKGPIMKIGQTLSYTQTSLPSNIAGAFAQLPDQSQPLDFAKILEQLKRAAPTALLQQIDFIDPNPLGIGSIGQVHQCRLKSGEIVAIKVKYPEIEKTVHSDFQLLKLIAKSIKLIHPRIPFEPFIRELESNILHECNYIREIESVERFYRRFQNDPHIVIPKPYREYSSEGVLVTSYEAGLKFQAIADGDADCKSIWAKSLVRFVVSSCRDGDFNTDPHPGNFLFRENQLVCLDFGSVNHWRAETVKAWNLLILACHENSEYYLSEALSVVNAHTKFSSGKLKEFLEILTLHEKEGFWTSRNSEIISSDKLARQLKKVIQIQSYFRMPTEIIFGMRVYFGHLSIVSLLGVEHNWNDLVNEIMLPWKLEHEKEY